MASEKHIASAQAREFGFCITSSVIPEHLYKSSTLFTARKVLVENFCVQIPVILDLGSELVAIAAGIVWMECPIEPSVAIKAFGASDFKG